MWELGAKSHPDGRVTFVRGTVGPIPVLTNRCPTQRDSMPKWNSEEEIHVRREFWSV